MFVLRNVCVVWPVMKCNICLRILRSNHANHVCVVCKSQSHEDCCKSTLKSNVPLKSWICFQCTANELPFNHILDDDDFLRDLYAFYNYTSHDLSSRLDSYAFDVFGMNEEGFSGLKRINYKLTQVKLNIWFFSPLKPGYLILTWLLT